MADVITRFKLETTQFDSKLRDTAKALQDIAHTAQFAGKDFNGFSQKSIEAARALGTVASGATNTKDKLKDLVGSYNDAAKAYNMLSEEAKKGEFGKAMAESLQKLQQDIKQTKDELYGLGEVASGKGGGLFGGKGFTDMLSVAGGNLLATGFSKITSELADTVQQSIELARSGEGVRLAFERLNKPGLLDNLKESTHGTVSELELMKAAVKFDDFKLPVEQLGTLLAFAQKKAKDTGQSVDYMVDSIVTGLGRKSLMILDNLGLSAAQIKERMAESGDMTKAVADIIKEQMAEAGEYVETAADRAARAAADAQNQMEELGRKAMPVAEEWGKAWNEIKVSGMEVLTYVLTPVAESLKDIREILSGEYELKIKANVPNYADDDGKTVWSGWKPGTDHTVQAPGGYVEGTDKNTGAVIGGQHFDNLNDANAIKDWQKTLFKTPKTTSSKKNPLDKIAFDTNKAGLAGEKVKDTMPSLKSLFDQSQMDASADAWKNYKDVVTESIGDIGDSMNDITKWTKNFDPYKEKLREITERQKQLQMAQDMAAQAANNFGAALAAIDDPAAKAAGTVISAIANIALGFGQAVASAGKMGPWAWLAYVAAGTAALATTISTVHSLTGYAEGGMIKGNSYSGDNIGGMVDGSQFVGLNAGELVLNRAQQANLAQSLQGNGGQTVRVVGKLAGKDLFICAENWAKSAGKGEFVTW